MIRAATQSRAQLAAETDDGGRFVRQVSRFRDWVSADGATGFRAEPGRYHLYVSKACPWAHRSIIVRRLKRLEDVITMSVVDPVRDDRGWRFGHGPGFSPDPVNGFDYLSEAYHASDPDFDGRTTVRMLNSAWDEWGDASVDLCPEDLREEITHDSINPTGIVPKGPELDLTKPHDRG